MRKTPLRQRYTAMLGRLMRSRIDPTDRPHDGLLIMVPVGMKESANYG
jgi:hypothetical protein